LIPTIEGKSYAIYELITTFDDPETGLCGHWSSTDKVTGRVEEFKNIKTGKTTFIQSHRIVNEGTELVGIVFDGIEEDCETTKRKSFQRTFRLNDGLFKETTFQ